MTVTPMICQHIALKLSVGEQGGCRRGQTTGRATDLHNISAEFER